MKKPEIPATIHDAYETFEAAGPGAIHYACDASGNVASVVIKCPGCGQVLALPLQRDPAQPFAPVWGFNGSRAKPSLAPSVHHKGECGWHGWLRKGRWRGC